MAMNDHLVLVDAARLATSPRGAVTVTHSLEDTHNSASSVQRRHGNDARLFDHSAAPSTKNSHVLESS